MDVLSNITFTACLIACGKIGSLLVSSLYRLSAVGWSEKISREPFFGYGLSRADNLGGIFWGDSYCRVKRRTQEDLKFANLLKTILTFF